MKGIKTILGAAAAVSLVVFSFNASAQENNNRDENGKVVRGAYHTNGLWDNWFIGVGAGINSVIDNGDNWGSIGFGADLNVGKWFTPAVGARVGWHGIENKAKVPGWFSGTDSFQYHFVHGDLLWNISNTLGGYKETRFWDLIPYAQFGAVLAGTDRSGSWDIRKSFGWGGGLLNDFHVGKHVDLFLDLSIVHTREGNYRPRNEDTYKWVRFPSITAGLIFNLGRTGFDRHSTVTPVVVPLPFTEADYDALNSRAAALQKENAGLKDRLAALEAEKASRVYKEGQDYIYQNGKFIETEAAIATPASLYFNIGKATRTERELAHLEYYIKHAYTGEQNVVVTGSADSKTGSAKYNQTLSEKRANYVKDLLVKNYSVPAERIQTSGVGGVDTFNTPAKNRVVVVEVK